MEPLRLIEPVPIDDDYITALAMIERCGPLARFVYVADATCYETGDPVRVVKRKLLLPIPVIRRNVAIVAAFLAGQPPSAPEALLRLVVG